MRSVDSAIRPVLVGYDAMNLHKDEPYIIRRPIAGGNLNVVPLRPEKVEDDPMDESESKFKLEQYYSERESLEDLEHLFTMSIEAYLKVPRANFHHFNCVLVLPDVFNKTHIRCIIEMIFGMGFKSLLMHQESVLACYALSLSTACVVDIGATKTTVCCIEDGVILPRSIIRKDFGGNDQTELMM